MSNEEKRNLRNALRRELLARNAERKANPLPPWDTNGARDRARTDMDAAQRLVLAGGNPHRLHEVD
jgi:hypothetical protein